MCVWIFHAKQHRNHIIPLTMRVCERESERKREKVRVREIRKMGQFECHFGLKSLQLLILR